MAFVLIFKYYNLRSYCYSTLMLAKMSLGEYNDKPFAQFKPLIVISISNCYII